jgi:hypothetical protein
VIKSNGNQSSFKIPQDIPELHHNLTILSQLEEKTESGSLKKNYTLMHTSKLKVEVQKK